MTTNEKRQYSEARSVSLYPDDWKIVEELARRLSIGVSTALRIIIEQWERQQ